MTKRTLSARPLVSKPREYGATCTIQRDNGDFCDEPSMAHLPASVCPKHAARIFLHLREFVDKADRKDLGMRLLGSIAQRERDTYRSSPASQVMDNLVYYVRVGDHIKIGHTSNLRNRMKAYPTGKLLAVEPGSLHQERKRHEQFSHALEVGREWFRITPDLMEHVRNLAARSA